MGDEVALEYASSRFYSIIVVLFSLSALVVTSIGLFALLSHAASRRFGEMGLRLALGATPQSTAALLLKTGLAPIAAGIVAGLAGAVLAACLLQGLLYGVGPSMPWRSPRRSRPAGRVGRGGADPCAPGGAIDPATSLRAE